MMTFESLRLPKAAAATTLLIIGVLTPPVFASGIPVVDAGHIATQIGEFTKELARYESMVEEWKSKLAINPLARPDNSLPKIGNQLQMRADDEGLDARCNRDGSGTMGGLGSLLGVSITFDPQGNLREEQKKLCSLQVMLENRKWNENVLLIRAMELQQEQVDAAAEQRSSGDTEGEANTKQSDIQVANGDFETIARTGGERIRMLDGMILSTRHMQAMVAQQLLAGQKPAGFAASVAQDLVQGAVLKAALEIGNDDCGGELGVPCG